MEEDEEEKEEEEERDGRGKGEEERGPNNKAIYHVVAREERDLWMTAYSDRGRGRVCQTQFHF